LLIAILRNRGNIMLIVAVRLVMGVIAIGGIVSLGVIIIMGIVWGKIILLWVVVGMLVG